MTHQQQGNATLWMIAIKRKLRDERRPAVRQLLAEMYIELNNRLPERNA